MTSPFLGQLMIVAFNFPPKGWAFCNGQLEPINQNQALFSLLGTQYGGNGVNTFALPNLQSRVPIGMGQGPGLSNYIIGDLAGAENVTLLESEVSPHTHTVEAANVSAAGSSSNGTLLAKTDVSGNQNFISYSSPVPLNQSSVQAVGGQPHTNIQPILVLTFCIALSGIFPSRT